MDYHLEHDLKLIAAPQNKTLYSWAIVEVDGTTGKESRDQICWEWTQNFRSKEFTVSDSLTIATRDLLGKENPAPEIKSRNIIRAKLTPGGVGPKNDRWEEPTYRMFGTDRVIEDFQLEVIPVAADQPETCSAWGCVSYTAETDFRYDTEPDVIVFYLQVRQERFDRYLWMIAQGLGDDISLSVGHVDGFYSEWSPSVSTRSIKVLARGNEQKIDMPELVGFEVPRLGNVGQVEFTLSSRRLSHPPAAGLASDRESQEGDLGTDDRRQGFRWPRRR